MSRRIFFRWVLCPALTLLLGTASAHADLWLVSGTTSGPVSASAVFTVTAGTITVTLTNTGANPHDVGQNLSALIFTVSTTVSGKPTVTSDAGTLHINGLRTISGSSATDSALGANAAGWSSSRHGSNSLELDVLSGKGHAGPAHTLVANGTGTNGVIYTGANGSLSTRSHNELIQHDATFHISSSGILADTRITGVTFQFGTHDGHNQLVGHLASANPEPSTLALAVLGALGFIGYGLRRRLKK